MLGIGDRERDELQNKIDTLTGLLGKNELMPIVNQRLYLRKDGTWDARFDMSGYSLGQPKLEELLSNFVFAATGLHQIPDEIMEEQGGLVYLHLMEAIDYAIFKLRTERKTTA